MARMHSRDRGSSGSKKPLNKDLPEWTKYSAEEITAIISKLAKEGVSGSQIGVKLRDSYGIVSVKSLTGKTMSEILKETGTASEIPEDLLALLKRVVFIRKHLESNKQDKTAKRGLRLTESKISRLIKYYKKSKKLPQDWSYDINKIRFLTE